MFYYSVTIFILLVASINAALLPDYFKKCSLLSSNLNKCLTKNAIEAWSTLVKGDINVHVQQLDPLNVPFLTANVNNKLIGNLTNAVLTGLADIEINEIKMDQNKQFFDLNFLIPSLNIFGLYDIKGEIVNLKLDGQGIANITFYNLSSLLHIDYELIEKKDKHYIHPVKNTMSLNSTFAVYHLDKLGDNVNQILNDNWEPVFKEVSGSLSDVVSEVFTEILKPFFKKVSYEELFSDV